MPPANEEKTAEDEYEQEYVKDTTPEKALGVTDCLP